MSRSRGMTTLAVVVLVVFIGSLTYQADVAAASAVPMGRPRGSVAQDNTVAPPDLERGVGRTDAVVPGAIGPSQDLPARSRHAQEVPPVIEPVVPPNPEDVLRSPYRIDNRIVHSDAEPSVLENASNAWIAQFRAMDDGGIRIVALSGDSIRVAAPLSVRVS